MVGKDFVFIHINKTGGSSIEHILRRDGSTLMPKHPDACETIGYWHPQHFTASEYLKVMGEEEYNKRYVFSVVRNPWDRMVSCYSMAHKVSTVTKDHFSPWVIQWLNRPNKPCPREPTKCKDHTRTFLPCADWVKGAKVDTIVRFENYAEEMESVYATLGTPVPIDRIRQVTRNSKKHRRVTDYREYFTDKARDIVANKLSADIDAYGYQF